MTLFATFPELCERGCKFWVIGCICFKRDTSDCCFPCLLNGANARSRTSGMADNAATAQIKQIRGAACTFIGFRRLTAPLAGTGNGKRAIGEA